MVGISRVAAYVGVIGDGWQPVLDEAAHLGQLIDPAEFSIARAARMSMSIPYFYEPVKLTYRDGTECSIVDGGVVSNFPVRLFDVDPSRVGRPPARPTFGFTLSGGRGFRAYTALQDKSPPWPLRSAFDILHTAQDAWDALPLTARGRTLAPCWTVRSEVPSCGTPETGSISFVTCAVPSGPPCLGALFRDRSVVTISMRTVDNRVNSSRARPRAFAGQ